MIYRSMILKGYTVPNLLMMMISIDNVEHYLFKGILYCNSFLGVKLTLFHTYCSRMYTAQLWCNYKNLPLLNYKLLIITFF